MPYIISVISGQTKPVIRETFFTNRDTNDVQSKSKSQTSLKKRNSSNCYQRDMNENIKMSSFKSSENIQKKEGGPDRSVSDNQSSSVTPNELAMKARKDTVISSFSKEVIH